MSAPTREAVEAAVGRLRIMAESLDTLDVARPDDLTATKDLGTLTAALEAQREVIEAIINASDGCVGHRHCNHSMEPWQRARAILGAPR